MSTRDIALTLLMRYEEEGKYANLLLSSHITDSLSKEERAFLTSLVYTAIERKITYDYYISALSGRGGGRGEMISGTFSCDLAKIQAFFK